MVERRRVHLRRIARKEGYNRKDVEMRVRQLEKIKDRYLS